LNHWPKLTLFLQQPGAPLDNNIVERALKKAILNRKNALFYRTLNGAGVGDLFMSLIHTCELNGANPFDYLTESQRHSEGQYSSLSAIATAITGTRWNGVAFFGLTRPVRRERKERRRRARLQANAQALFAHPHGSEAARGGFTDRREEGQTGGRGPKTQLRPLQFPLQRMFFAPGNCL
jgi:hypothetical protein